MRQHVHQIVAVIGLFAAAAACAPSGTQPNPASDTTAVNAVRDQFIAAFNAGDAGKVADLYVSDAIVMPSHHAAVTGKDAILAYNRDFFGQVTAHIAVTALETKLMGDWAYDRGTFTMTVTPKAGGASMSDQGKYLVLLQKQSDGSWKLTRDIDNSDMPMPAPPPPPPPPAKGKAKGK